MDKCESPECTSTQTTKITQKYCPETDYLPENVLGPDEEELSNLVREELDYKQLTKIKYRSVECQEQKSFDIYIQNLIKKKFMRYQWIFKPCLMPAQKKWSLVLTLLQIINISTIGSYDWLIIANICINTFVLLVQGLRLLKSLNTLTLDLLQICQFVWFLIIPNSNDEKNLYYCILCLNLSSSFSILIAIVVKLIDIHQTSFTIIFILLYGAQISYQQYQRLQNETKDDETQNHHQYNEFVIKMLCKDNQQGIILFENDVETQTQQKTNDDKGIKLLYMPISVYTSFANNNQPQNENLYFHKRKFDNLYQMINQLSHDQVDKISENSRIIAKDKQRNLKYSLFYKEFNFNNQKKQIIQYSSVISKILQDKLLRSQHKFHLSLVSSLTHKLKTPLSAALIHLQAALTDQDMTQRILKIYIQPAYYNCQLQLYQVQDILDYISQDSEQLQINPQSINIVKVAKQVLEIVSQPIKSKQIDLKFSINNEEQEQSDQITFFTDENKLSRVLVNLLNNAYRFTQQGGQIILNINYIKNTNTAQFVIEDTGHGMTENQFDQLNKELNSSDRSRGYSYSRKDSTAQHQGISLSVANKLVKVLNIQNQPLQVLKVQGTRFQFNIDNINETNSALTIKSLRNIEQFKSIRDMASFYQPQSGQIRSRAISQFCIQKDKSLLQQKDLSFEDINDEPSHHHLMSFDAKQNYHHMHMQESLIENNHGLTPKPTINYQYFQSQKSASKTQIRKSEGGIKLFASFSQINIPILEQIQQNKGYIMIVDDEPFNHVSLGIMLKQMKIQDIRSAYNGQECLDMLLNSQDDVRLVIMDVDMPIMDGIQASLIITEYQQKKQLKEFPIIGCTAHQDQETHELCLDSGMLAVLQKPVFQKNLYELIKILEDPIESQQVLGKYIRHSSKFLQNM